MVMQKETLHLELVWELKVRNKNLGSVVCLCLLIATYGLETVLSLLFSNIATPHTLPARLLNFWRRLITVRKKKLKDSSNHVKSEYAAMIKLESEFSKQGHCLLDWSMLCPFWYIRLFFQSNTSKFHQVKAHKIPLPLPKITRNQSSYLCSSQQSHMQFGAHVSHTGQTLSDYMVSEPINRDIRKSIARCLVCWSKLNKRTITKRDEQRDRRAQGTQNPHSFNTFPWWGSQRHNAPEEHHPLAFLLKQAQENLNKREKSNNTGVDEEPKTSTVSTLILDEALRPKMLLYLT